MVERWSWVLVIRPLLHHCSSTSSNCSTIPGSWRRFFFLTISLLIAHFSTNSPSFPLACVLIGICSKLLTLQGFHWKTPTVCEVLHGSKLRLPWSRDSNWNQLESFAYYGPTIIVQPLSPTGNQLLHCSRPDSREIHSKCVYQVLDPTEISVVETIPSSIWIGRLSHHNPSYQKVM